MYARVRRCIRPYSLVLPGHSAGRECATLYRPVYNVCVPMQLWRTRGKQTGEAALNSQLVEYIVWNVLGLTNGVITARFGASPPVETLPTLWTGALISS